jgi:hypothetical protein
METADILTPWVLDVDVNSPRLIGDHSYYSMVEITHNLFPVGETPDPNNVVVRIVATTADMDTIAADPDYTILEGTRQPA